jgi:hypothetical protein
MKEKGSLMVVPSSTVDSLSVGGMAGLAAWHGAQASPLPIEATVVKGDGK